MTIATNGGEPYKSRLKELFTQMTTPQALLNGLMKVQEKIRGESIKKSRWYQKGADSAEIPIPLLGPDLIDPRKIGLIKNGEKA